MKNILTFILLLNALSYSISQSSNNNTKDAARIAIAPYVSDQIANFPNEAKNLLNNKLNQIVTNQGMSGSANNERFIITANISITNKDITHTAPPQHSYTLDVTFYIGDGFSGKIYSTVTKTYLGIAPSETKAYIEALKQIKSGDKSFVDFVQQGKDRILDYYNSQCDFILKSSQTAASQNNYEDAIYQLTQVPEVCKECYDKCMNAVGPLVQKQLDRDCASKLTQANTLWSANRDVYTANQVSEILSTIDPQANCFKDVKLLSAKIEARVKELDNREWKLALKIQQDDVDIQKANIKAARDIGVAYGNNQPKTITTYNISGWW